MDFPYITAKESGPDKCRLLGECLRLEPHSTISVTHKGFVVRLHLHRHGTLIGSELKRSEVMPWLFKSFKDCGLENVQLHQGQIVAQLSRLSKARIPFDYDIDENLRRVTELAPVVPPEFLQRISRHLPLVEEAAELIGNWYMYLCHMFYEDVNAKLNPGCLDEYLDRMYNWLVEVKGVSQTRLHNTKEEAQ